MSSFQLYIHTIKYLKPSQIYHRVLKKFTHPKPKNIQANRATANLSWVTQPLHSRKFITESKVCFLNQDGIVEKAGDWNNNVEEKLWLYNLHYFDDLASEQSDTHRAIQKAWLEKWVLDNPPEKGGNGWEPYTLSLRIVNWIKAFLSGHESNEDLLRSLAQQADFLSQDLEKHLLGNHYFVNLKALLFAGCYFEGKEADRWLTLALKDFEKEMGEQVLDDGGSFELSPMYHAIMLADLLDLLNLFRTYPDRVSASTVQFTQKVTLKMFDWLDNMSLNDSGISFFNDSAFGIAPSNETLKAYANKLEINPVKRNVVNDALTVKDLKQTGYISVKAPSMTLIADLAEVGPSYIPGHAHADTFSFELSLGKSRVFVNSGTSMYGVSSERARQRGTAAHNTLVLNNTNSSQVWSGFRVAKRANVTKKFLKLSSCGRNVRFGGTHNGYVKQNIDCLHSRSWNMTLNSVEIEDILAGKYNNAFSYLHLHPDIKVLESDLKSCILKSKSHKIEVKIFGGELNIEETTWHPEFGVSQINKKLVIKLTNHKIKTNIQWTDL